MEEAACRIFNLPPPKKRLWKGLGWVGLAVVFVALLELVDDTEPLLASEEVLARVGDSASGFAPVFARNWRFSSSVEKTAPVFFKAVLLVDSVEAVESVLADRPDFFGAGDPVFIQLY